MYSERAYLSEGNLSLEDSWYRDFVDGRPTMFEKSEKTDLAVVEDRTYFQKERKVPEQMSYKELKQYIQELDERDFDTVKFKVDLNYKVSFPLASLVMTLLGIPFAFSMGKRGTLVGIGLSIVIVIVYWGAISAFRPLGNINFLPPFLAAWGANLIFGLIGLYLLFTLKT